MTRQAANRFEVDLWGPASARVWNYWLGGKDHFEIDREVGAAVKQIWDIGASARATRAYAEAAIAHTACAEVDQFLDIGAGLPWSTPLHQIAQQHQPQARVAYTDHDPMVTAYGRALMSTGTGPVDWFEADLTYPDEVIDQVDDCLDLRRPVVVSACAVVDDIADHERSVAALARIMASTVPGSYLIMTGIAGDLDHDGVVEASRTAAAQYGLHWYPRTITQVQDYLTDLDVLECGPLDHQTLATPLRTARPNTAATALRAWGALARKPGEPTQ